MMPAKSKSQQMAAGAALSAKRGDRSPSGLQASARSMYDSMSEQELRKNGVHQAEREAGSQEEFLEAETVCHFTGASHEPERKQRRSDLWEQGHGNRRVWRDRRQDRRNRRSHHPQGIRTGDLRRDVFRRVSGNGREIPSPAVEYPPIRHDKRWLPGAAGGKKSSRTRLR